MRLTQAGDTKAYRQLLKAVSSALLPLSKAKLRRFGLSEASAEDVVQDTLLAIHMKGHTWDASRPFVPWLMTLHHYKLVDALRRRGHTVHVSLDDGADDVADATAEPSFFEDDLQRLTTDLPTHQRTAIEAVYLHGALPAEAAEAAGVSENTFRVRLHRGLQALGVKMKGSGYAS